MGSDGQFEKKYIFNLDLKDDNDEEFLMSSEMLFQNFGAATPKPHEPK